MLASISVDNSVRGVIIGQAILFLLLSLLVLARYFGRPGNRLGDLPWHILGLAGFSIITAIGMALDMLARWDINGVSWRCPLWAAALFMGNSGMIIMLSRLFFRSKIRTIIPSS